MRTDYDQIAAYYDRNPIRCKSVDADLLEWLASPAAPSAGRCVIVDVGCGTGNQLVADRPHVPRGTRLMGIDASIGRLRQARAKQHTLAWVRGLGERLPLLDGAVHYLTNQFSYHHVADRTSLFAELYRVLKSGGRLVLTDIDPRRMSRRPFYGYFPEALERDLKDFLPTDDLCEAVERAGCTVVDCSHEDLEYETDLKSFRKAAKERTACSQLTAISDDAWQRGLARIDSEIAARGTNASLSNPFATVKIIADKP